jgi:hypothetical protein
VALTHDAKDAQAHMARLLCDLRHAGRWHAPFFGRPSRRDKPNGDHPTPSHQWRLLFQLWIRSALKITSMSPTTSNPTSLQDEHKVHGSADGPSQRTIRSRYTQGPRLDGFIHGMTSDHGTSGSNTQWDASPYRRAKSN